MLTAIKLVKITADGWLTPPFVTGVRIPPGWSPGVCARGALGLTVDPDHGPVPGSRCRCGWTAVATLADAAKRTQGQTPADGAVARVALDGTVIETEFGGDHNPDEPRGDGLRAGHMKVIYIVTSDPAAGEAAAERYGVEVALLDEPVWEVVRRWSSVPAGVPR